MQFIINMFNSSWYYSWEGGGGGNNESHHIKQYTW